MNLDSTPLDGDEPFQLTRAKGKPPQLDFGSNRGRQREMFPGWREDLPDQTYLFQNYGTPEEQ